MMQKRRTLLLLIWFGLVLIACNLTDSPPPPSLVPRATSTPPATIGYATLSPTEFPIGATQISPNQQQPDITVTNLISQVVPDRLFSHISSLVNMQTRHVFSSMSTPNQGIGAAARYITAEFEAIRQSSFQQAFSVFTQQFPVEFGGRRADATNIIGVLQGYETGAGVIVVGAHYDSITINFENTTTFAPGANDNASGIGALIELARIMSQKRHRATIMFVAFSAEEIQRKGSLAFVREYLQNNNVQVTAMINMDIIGSRDSADGSINDTQIRAFSGDPFSADPNESRSRQLARSISMIAERSGAPLEILVEPSIDREGRYSDHFSFADAGYPAVRFIEANEDSSRHHTERDTIDDINVTYYVRATQTILTVLNGLADGPRPPTSISLRDAGNGLRTLVWERTPDAVGYVIALRPPGAVKFSEAFSTVENTVTWEGFIASRFIGVAIAAVDSNGVVGPFSVEYRIAS